MDSANLWTFGNPGSKALQPHLQARQLLMVTVAVRTFKREVLDIQGSSR